MSEIQQIEIILESTPLQVFPTTVTVMLNGCAVLVRVAPTEHLTKTLQDLEDAVFRTQMRIIKEVDLP